MTRPHGGARLMLGFHGTEASDELRELLHETQARSVILFARNIVDAAQTRDLIASVRALVPWPLLVAVDQEGGAVVRVTSGATVFPGNMALGSADDPELARRVGRASGAELAGIGFDLNLGPVVDLQTNPANPGIGIRSFGADRARATELARAWVEGHADGGVHCCLKHFPGKGAASVDAHLDLPVLEHSLEEFRDPHLRIFEDLLGEFGERVTVMTTHVVVRGLDPDLPATLSPRVVAGFLRDEIGFDGLVITDDLEMGAIDKHHGVAEAALKAAVAGHDVLPICHRPERQRAAAALLESALEDGRLDVEAHARSCARIERLAASTVEAARRGLVATDSGLAATREVCERAYHVFGDARQLLPLSADVPVLVLAAEPYSVVGVEEAADRDWSGLVERSLRDAGIESLEMRAFDLEKLEADLDAETDRLFAEAGEYGRVLLLGWNARGSAAMRSLLERASSTLASKLIVAHLRNPFDQAFLADDITSVTAFGYRVQHIEALARGLAGLISVRGRMPAPLA